jgi:ankyrin repeat protein
MVLLLADSEICIPVDVGDKGGITPLQYATAYNQYNSVIALLEAGAALWHIDDLNRRTFIDYALIRGHLDLAIGVLTWYDYQVSCGTQPEA